MPSPVVLARVVRSGLEESVHLGDVAVVDADGRVVASAGDPERPLYARSSMKPLQATVSLSFTPFEFDDREVAVMCASHNAEPIHVETVRSLLRRAGVSEDSLQTPPARPWDDESLVADPKRRPINSDCSGKHGGMLAACRAQGWPAASYRDPGHPLQRAVLETVLAAAGVEDVHIGVDGCGVPVHGMPLRAMATIYARLASPARLGGTEPFARRAIDAMTAQPYLVAGRNRPDTAVMQIVPGVAAKGGAEGLLCGALLGRGLGVAVKVRDGGAARAAGPAFIRTLEQLDALTARHLFELAPFAAPPVLGGGAPVGSVVADFDLNPA